MYVLAVDMTDEQSHTTDELDKVAHDCISACARPHKVTKYGGQTCWQISRFLRTVKTNVNEAILDALPSILFEGLHNDKDVQKYYARSSS